MRKFTVMAARAKAFLRGESVGAASRAARRALVVPVMVAGIGVCACSDSQRRVNDVPWPHATGEFGSSAPNRLSAPIDIGLGSRHVVLVDALEHRVLLYGRNGDYVASFGGRGQAPGELERPSAVGFIGDTVWVLDAGNARINAYTLAGDFISGRLLPGEVRGANHMIYGGSCYTVASVSMVSNPLVQFCRDSQKTLKQFGSEMVNRAREMTEGRPLPNAFRLATIDGEIWVLHVNLPLIGIYNASGGFVRLVEYPDMHNSPDTSLGFQRSRARQTPAEPVGSIGVLPGPGQSIYLLTHQLTRGGRQIFYLLDRNGNLLGRTVSPLQSRLAFSVWDDSVRAYAVASAQSGEPHILSVQRPTSPSSGK